ncbi:hypothetical protein DM01DRAFT_1368946 [Hesseltinella vesiculosa]|uniref:Nucleotide-diphospho-sugar transferase n=1 Tax=Hesseltinella vesiculosa TaxID=101127 RepID=A0A1X2G393_9FUNG|nr:hypothetical protein DM01DRAFT_1368946 [Hesseltinella vesiculosa]
MHRVSIHHQKKALYITVVFLTLSSLLFVYRQTNIRQQHEVNQLKVLEEAKKLDQMQQDEQQRVWIESKRTVKEPVLGSYGSIWPSLLQTHDIAFPSKLPAWTEADSQLLHMAIGESVRANLFTVQENKIDFRQMTTQLRLFKTLYQYFDPLLALSINVETNATYKEAWHLYKTLETQLFPWLEPTWKSVFEMNSRQNASKPTRGIVICAGNGQYHYALRAVQAIRKTLKSSLPIELYAIDEYDLSPAKRAVLESFDDTTVHNIKDIIGNEGTEFGGWSLKPYAMVATKFTEVILMDADVYFFKPPETVFEDDGYIATGALFFYDRTLFDGWTIGKEWLSSFLPSMSSLVRHTRWWKFESAHEQESGVVVIDKSRTLLGLLATCKMNGKRERDEVSYKHVHGDKETFWVGFEMMQTPYAFVKSHAAVLGALGDGGDENKVCGVIMHLDAKGRPYWWNGAIYRDKNRWQDRYIKFKSFAIGESWDFENSCIEETDKIHALTEEEVEVGEAYIQNNEDLKQFDIVN